MEESQSSPWEIICGEIEKISGLLAGHPQLSEQITPCLDKIRTTVEGALPCLVLPGMSIKEYTEQLPEVMELHSAVVAAGDRYVFHGYTFWATGDGAWSLTNPLGMDDVMLLRDLNDFARFLTQLRAGSIIYPE